MKPLNCRNGSRSGGCGVQEASPLQEGCRAIGDLFGWAAETLTQAEFEVWLEILVHRVAKETARTTNWAKRPA